MNFMVTLDRDEGGVYVTKCPAIPDCISQDGTEEEPLENIGNAIRQCLEIRTERGMPLTVATYEINVALR